MITAIITPSFTAELVCYVILFSLLFWRQRLLREFRGLDAGRQLFLGVFLVAMLAGHLIDRSTQTYPLVAWSMFTRPVHGDPIFQRYTGIREDGTQIDLHFDRLFPNTLGRNTIHKMSRLRTAIGQSATDQEREQHVSQYEAILQALARRYNADHRDNPVRQIQVWECRVPLNDADLRPTATQCEFFWAVRIVSEE